MYNYITDRLKQLQKQFDVASYHSTFTSGGCVEVIRPVEQKREKQADILLKRVPEQMVVLFDVIRSDPESLERFIVDFNVEVETLTQHFQHLKKKSGKWSEAYRIKMERERFYSYTWENKPYGKAKATFHVCDKRVFLTVSSSWARQGKRVIEQDSIPREQRYDGSWRLPYCRYGSIRLDIKKP